LKIIFDLEKPERIDIFLSKKLKISRSATQKLILEKIIINSKKPKKTGVFLKKNDEIKILEKLENQENLDQKNISQKIKIIFENYDFLIVEKKSGIVVPPDKNHPKNSLAEILINMKKIPKEMEKHNFGVVHRLDKPVSGILIFSKNPNTSEYFWNIFKKRQIKKKYFAITFCPQNFPLSGEIDAPICRDKKNRQKMTIKSSQNSRNAKTFFEILEQKKEFSQVEIFPQTGRMHQIRTHLSSIGLPILGDKIYGNKKLEKKLKIKIPRIFLHAEKLIFIPPGKKSQQEFFCSIPKEFEIFWEQI